MQKLLLSTPFEQRVGIKFTPHPFSKFQDISDGIKHATYCQAVGILSQQRCLNDAPSVVGCLEVWVLQFAACMSATHCASCFPIKSKRQSFLIVVSCC